ncbi:YhgE/Pip domain-containing protein [Corynebacterium sp. SCR221107]|uniref:YhgE/Pip domain-containing protein n=1 Tax=Corynebacterium sp. SCR221107 TaxID=3017361 RepID=UPI0022EC3759|nr:YhgE/Pip domain-containing protein [Corynebacterium sp. SCR221107]WBT09010.1 YhgE/Pip domain-containing protein [Corynebacterium sp. SCR221107]
MKTSWRVFVRDAKRILAVPKAFIIVIGILITPALYAWLNIAAFWDPYNNTEAIPIAVVNEDKGATSDLTGEIKVGDQIVDQLRQNDQLGWEFLSADEADEKIHRGEVYASFVIPEEFSQQLVDIFSGSRAQPTIEYSVNEKKGAIAPKITDAGSNSLDIKITSAFREQLGKAVSETLRDRGVDFSSSIQDTQSTTTQTLQDLEAQLGTTRDNVQDIANQLADSGQTASDVKGMLAAADPALGDVATSLSNIQSILDTVITDAQAFAQSTGDASAKAQEALGVSTANARSALTSTSAMLGEVGTQIQGGTDRFSQGITAAENSLTAAEAALGAVSQPLAGDTLAGVRTQLDQAQAVVDQLNQVASTATETSRQLDALGDDFATLIDGAQDSSGALRSTSNEAVNSLTTRVTALSARAGLLAGQAAQAQSSLGQITALVDGLEDQLQSTQDILVASDGNLADLQDSARNSEADVAALATALQSGTLQTVTGLDADNIGTYLASPVEFEKQALFPVASYGSAMSPMFINLSLWIGTFMLIIIFRVEVDKEGFRALALRHAYFGRFLLLSVLAIAQAIIVSVGTLLIGVQTVNAFAFVATAVVIGLSYFAIIYALAAAFGHVGRAIAVVLVVLQIPGASGIYPIELMPGFFRAIYPVLPFSYSIKAIRETVGGFYGNQYLHYMAIVCAMGLIALIVGLILRRQLGYFTRLFNDELARTELVINENVEILGSGYRLSHIIALLSNRGEFSRELTRRREKFDASYPMLVRVLTIIGLAGLFVLGILSRATSISKPGLLAVATLWGLIVVGALVTTESLKQSLRHASELEALSEDDLVAALRQHRAIHSATTDEPNPEAQPAEKVLATGATEATDTNDKTETTEFPAQEGGK